MKKNSGATLKDVAKLAGVSLATASRVLNSADYPVSQALQNRIRKAANDLNYTPNMFAKMLKGNSYPAIGVIVPTLQNPFFNQVILGIESVARKYNYEIMIFSSHRSIEQERNNINSLLQNRILSLIIISIDTDRSAIQNYMDCGGVVAMLESNFNPERSIVTETDYVGAGQIAVEHLVEHGHRKIAFLTSPLTKTYRRSILAGVRETMREYGFSFEDKDVFVAEAETETESGLYEFELGKQLAVSFLERKEGYTAIIAINDLTAFGIIQALGENGVSVPNDVSVISFDNITYSEMISPPLTTVELPSGSMGASVCTMLINAVSNPDENLTDVVFKFHGHLVERGSVINAKK